VWGAVAGRKWTEDAMHRGFIDLPGIIGWIHRYDSPCGLKPSRGLLSTKGAVPACRSPACVSNFALCAEDAEAVLRVAAQYDGKDSFFRTTKRCACNGGGENRLPLSSPKKINLHFFGNEAAQLCRMWPGLNHLAAGGRILRRDKGGPPGAGGY